MGRKKKVKEPVKEPVESETEESDAPEAKRMTRGGGGKNNQSYRKLGKENHEPIFFSVTMICLFINL